MKRVVIDTNIIIRSFYQGTEEFLLQQTLLGTTKIYISAISYAEVLVALSRQEKKYFENLLTFAEIIEVTRSIAEQAAAMRKVSFKTKRVYLLDCIIAATALAKNAKLITNNSKDFTLFPEIEVVSPGEFR